MKDIFATPRILRSQRSKKLVQSRRTSPQAKKYLCSLHAILCFRVGNKINTNLESAETLLHVRVKNLAFEVNLPFETKFLFSRGNLSSREEPRVAARKKKCRFGGGSKKRVVMWKTKSCFFEASLFRCWESKQQYRCWERKPISFVEGVYFQRSVAICGGEVKSHTLPERLLHYCRVYKRIRVCQCR